MEKYSEEITPMKDTTNYIEPETVEKMIGACENERDRMLILFLARTGRRVSEVVRGRGNYGIKPKDVDFNNNIIYFTILKKKNKLKKPKPIEPMLMGSLKSYIEKYDIGQEDFIFPITRQRAMQILNKITKKIGLRTIGGGNIQTRTFRHSFAILGAKKLKSAEDLVLLKESLDHSSLQVTQFYLQFNPERQRELLKHMWSPDVGDKNAG